MLTHQTLSDDCSIKSWPHHLHCRPHHPHCRPHHPHHPFPQIRFRFLPVFNFLRCEIPTSVEESHNFLLKTLICYFLTSNYAFDRHSSFSIKLELRNWTRICCCMGRWRMCVRCPTILGVVSMNLRLWIFVRSKPVTLILLFTSSFSFSSLN